MAKIVIFGTGDIARLAHYYFTNDSEHEVAAFTVDREYLSGTEFCGLPVVDFAELPHRYAPADYKLFIAISYARLNQLRAEKYQQAKERGYELATYVSSRCSYLSATPPGDNCFILEDNTIQPFVKIGHDVTLWSGNHIGHDSVIDDHVFVASHIVISGHCHIGEYCFLGVNATLRNGITIAPHSLVGAGALIMKSTVQKGVYIPQRTEKFSMNSDEIQL